MTEKELPMTENSIIILGVLALFSILAVTAIALVFNRGIAIKASQSSVEVETKATASEPERIATAEDDALSR